MTKLPTHIKVMCHATNISFEQIKEIQ